MRGVRHTSVHVIVILLSLLTVIFMYGIFLYPHSGLTPSGLSLEAPSEEHLLGTDNLGIDIFAQLSRGFFFSMLTGLCAAGIAFVVGGLLGMFAGYLGGKIDLMVSFAINVFLSVPQLPVLIVLGSFWGQSIWNIVVIVAIFSWAPIAKQVRAKTISVRNQSYIMLSKSYGGTASYVIRTHILPELAPLLIINALAVVGKAILQESSLAYLGLSDPLAKSWGLMINRATAFSGIYFTDYWKWWLISPVIALVVTILLTRLLARSLEVIYLEGTY